MLRIPQRLLITLLFLAVTVIWALSGLLVNYFLPGWNERSAFGDMFGAANALFSALAFAGLIIAIYLQTQELSLQRQELKDTRNELKRTAEAQEKSEKALGEQVIALHEQAAAIVRQARAAEESVQELREAREQESAPYVVVYFDASVETFLIYLVIKNIGKAFANQVKLVFDPPLRNSTRGIEIANIPLIKDGIGSIPPGYEMRTLFDSSVSYFGNGNLPLSYTVKISYSGNLQDHVRSYEQTLDLAAFLGMGDIQRKGFNDLVKQIEEISKFQKETNNTLRSLLHSVKGGIWLRNQDFIIRTPDFQANSWRQHVLAKLSEFRDLWLSIKESEEDVELATSGLQAKCMLISEQVIAVVSNRPIDTPREIIAELNVIAAKLAELGRLRFYLGKESSEKFINLADTVIEKIAKVEKELLLETDEQNHS